MADFKIDKKFFKKWVKALRSGEFKQGIKRLKSRATGGFCCLGVACVVKGRTTKKAFKTYTRSGSSLESEEWAGNWLLPKQEQEVLASLNDGKRFSFKKIANHIENTYLKA